jgi:hypothetical protein
VSQPHIAAASQDLIASGATFQDSVRDWLDPIEKRVLQQVTIQRPASVRQLRRRLEGTFAGAELDDALERLRAMGFVARDAAGRHQAAGPLLAMWIEEHLEPEGEGERRRTRQLRWLAAGTAMTVGLFTGYYSWARLERRTTVYPAHGDVDGCRYYITSPETFAPSARAGGKGAIAELLFQRHCRVGGVPHALGLIAAPGTEALDNGDEVELSDVLGNHTGVKRDLDLREPDPDTHSFNFRVVLDGHEQPEPIRIAVDRMATVRHAYANASMLSYALPALLGGIVTFFNDLVALFGRVAGAVGRGRKETS